MSAVIEVHGDRVNSVVTVSIHRTDGRGRPGEGERIALKPDEASALAGKIEDAREYALSLPDTGVQLFGRIVR